jgi:class 3 adenylate cyclase
MKRKIAAILAADIVGYSKLVAEDEEETVRRLASYRSVIDDFIVKASGRTFNIAGDALLAEFPSAVEAVRCAIDIQESVRTRNLGYPPSRQMKFRIGITVGDVIERDSDLLGDGVNIAARLEGLAEAGGICVSRSVYEQVANKLSVKFADIGEQHVKNIPTAVHAYRVEIRSPDGTMRTRQSKPARLVAAIILIGIAALGGAGVIYLTFMRAPRPAPMATVPSSVATPAAPHVVTAQESLVPSQSPSQITVATAPLAVARFNEANVRALAAKHDIPLPQTIRFIEPSSRVPEKAVKYLGVWGGDRRWGGNGRQMILLVTHIDDLGTAIGVFAHGPPNPNTYDQNPANYWSFTGTITDNDLKFDSPGGGWKYTFKIRADEIMEGRAVSPKNTHPTINLERIN